MGALRTYSHMVGKSPQIQSRSLAATSIRAVEVHLHGGHVIDPVLLHDVVDAHLRSGRCRRLGLHLGLGCHSSLRVPPCPVADGGEVVLVALAAAVHVRAQAVDALLPICGELGLELREVGVRQLDVAVTPIGALLLGSRLRRGGRISISTCSLFTFSIRICFFSI